MQIAHLTYRKITFIALLALIVIVITGGAVRLTGSGLGCPDWPTCKEGQLAADLEYHALVEFINRVITGVTGLAVILAVLGAIFLVPKQKNLIWWAMGLAIGVLGQAILGGLVVLYHLTPSLVVAHFLVSMVLIWNAVILHHKTHPGIKPKGNNNTSESNTTAESNSLSSESNAHNYIIWLTRLATLLTASVIVAGTILTGAGPHSGDDGDGEVGRYGLDISNLARIHAGLVIALLSVMALGGIALYYFHPNTHPKIWQKGRVLLFITLAQGFIGYVQYFSDVPVLLVGIHIAGATLLWATMISFHIETCPPLRRNGTRVDLDLIKSSTRINPN